MLTGLLVLCLVTLVFGGCSDADQVGQEGPVQTGGSSGQGGTAATGGSNSGGDSGSAGDSGQGNGGTAGSMAGNSGTSGSAGTAGSAGTFGNSGASGESGTAGSAGSSGNQPGLTLLTLNLHCLRLDGTSYATNDERFAAIAEFAVANQVDVMTVQEACIRPNEDAITMLKDKLSQASGVDWSSAWNLAHVAWEGTPEEAEEGVGLLVQGMMSDVRNGEHLVQASLRRTYISAILPESLGGHRVMSVHLDVFDEPTRISQAREASVAALVQSEPDFSAIVAGDFNDVENSSAWESFVSMGYISADQGLNATGIDHVMVHRATPLRPLSVIEVFTGADAVSDHPGVLVTFDTAMGDSITITKITTEFQAGAGHYLSVRGDHQPLTWELGYPLVKENGSDTIIVTEINANFEYKLLVDDITWQTGANEQGVPGSDNSVNPVFLGDCTNWDYPIAVPV